MRDALVLMLVAGSLPLIFMRPWIGILVWSWLGYMNPHRLTWGFAYDFPFAQVVGIVTLMAIFFYRGERKIDIMPLVVVWGLFVLWMNLSTITALDVAKSSVEWDRTMKIQLFAVLTLMLIRTRFQVNMLVWVIAGSLGFFGLKGGVFSVLTGGNYLVWGPSGSFIEDNNALGLAMVMTIPLLIYLLQTSREKAIKLALFGVIAFTGLAILTTHSRGALLATAAMGGIFWLYSPRKIPIGILLVVGGIVAFGFMPAEWHERMGTIRTYQDDGSAMGRINAWWFAFNFALDHPFTGGGFGTFTERLFLRYAPIPDDFHDAHSIYFEVLAEHGFGGLLLFLSLGAGSILTSMHTVRMARKREDLDWVVKLSKLIVVSLISYAVGGAFLGLAYFDLYYHLIALTVILRRITLAPPEHEDFSVISEQMKNLRIKHGMKDKEVAPKAAPRIT